jgi:hypothetical protein
MPLLARLAFTRQSGREASLLRLAQTEIDSGLSSSKFAENSAIDRSFITPDALSKCFCTVWNDAPSDFRPAPFQRQIARNVCFARGRMITQLYG